MRLNRLTLEFSGDSKAFETRFIAFYFENSIFIFRFAAATGIVFYGFFGILDGILVPEIKHYLWVIRYAVVCPFLLFGFLLSFTSHFEKHWQTLSASLILSAGVGILVMIILVPQPINYFYYAGLILVIFYSYTFMRIKFITATMVGWLIVALYQLVAIWLTQSPREVIISNNFFLVGANILGMFACYLMEYYTRKNFYVSCVLENEKNTVADMNAKLEKKVLELSHAFDKIEILSGLIPICANCKKVRDDTGYWNQLDSYIETHSKAEFSHSMCPECSDTLYGDQEWYKKMKKKKAESSN